MDHSETLFWNGMIIMREQSLTHVIVLCLHFQFINEKQFLAQFLGCAWPSCTQLTHCVCTITEQRHYSKTLFGAFKLPQKNVIKNEFYLEILEGRTLIESAL